MTGIPDTPLSPESMRPMDEYGRCVPAMAARPIGIFDSGIGGLTVLKMLRDAFPAESFLYFGDLGRSPYGSKAADTVRRYVMQITDFLLKKKVKMIVIACNTASAVAGDNVRKRAYPVPVIEVVGCGAKMALDMIPEVHRDVARIGILGTDTTVTSEVYVHRIHELAQEGGFQCPDIRQQACPLFVPLVEEGWWHGEVSEKVAEIYLGSMKSFDPHVVILGCTHFPLLADPIARALPEGTILTDCAPAVVVEVKSILDERGWRAAEGIAVDEAHPAETVFFCSDTGDTFRRQAERFLDMSIEFVHHVDLEMYEDEEGFECFHQPT